MLHGTKEENQAKQFETFETHPTRSQATLSESDADSSDSSSESDASLPRPVSCERPAAEFKVTCETC